MISYYIKRDCSGSLFTYVCRLGGKNETVNDKQVNIKRMENV